MYQRVYTLLMTGTKSVATSRHVVIFGQGNLMARLNPKAAYGELRPTFANSRARLAHQLGTGISQIPAIGGLALRYRFAVITRKWSPQTNPGSRCCTEVYFACSISHIS
jgi:hypothetical protein